MVFTLISNDLTESSRRSAVFTRVVMPVSSTYWPVLSWFCEEAQPPERPQSASVPIMETRAASLRVFVYVFIVVVGNCTGWFGFDTLGRLEGQKFVLTGWGKTRPPEPARCIPLPAN